MGEDVSAITRLQGYQSELRVNEEEAHPMRGFASACRLVFNRALAFQQEMTYAASVLAMPSSRKRWPDGRKHRRRPG